MNAHDQEQAILLALMRFSGFGAKRLGQMYRYFGNWSHIWGASELELRQAGVAASVVHAFLHAKPTISPEEEWQRVFDLGANLVMHKDPNYPRLLSEIHDPPVALLYHGELPNPHAPLVSIVGSRKMTAYGRRVLEEMIPPLVDAGVQVVSGLALGVDGFAQHLTLEHGGVTHAVLAGGIGWDEITPSQHRSLARRIVAQGGSVLSEKALGTLPTKGLFPLRNRIVVGMSRATIVVEAAPKSGSLISARLALESNRDVFAVPGPIDSTLSKGTNRLLRDGAIPYLSAQDVLAHLGLENTPTANPVTHEPQNAAEHALFPLLSREPIHVDDLIRDSRLPAYTVQQTLSALELRDVVIHAGGNQYRFR